MILKDIKNKFKSFFFDKPNKQPKSEAKYYEVSANDVTMSDMRYFEAKYEEYQRNLEELDIYEKNLSDWGTEVKIGTLKLYLDNAIESGEGSKGKKNYFKTLRYKVLYLFENHLYHLENSIFYKRFETLQEAEKWMETDEALELKTYHYIKIFKDYEKHKFYITLHFYNSDYEINPNYYALPLEAHFIYAATFSLIESLNLHDFLTFQLDTYFESNAERFKTYLKDLILTYKDELQFNDYTLLKMSDFFNDESLKLFLRSLDKLSILKEAEDNEELNIPNDWIKIKGVLNTKQIRHFFSFLHTETLDDDNLTFLKKHEVDEILMNGFSISPTPRNKKFRLNTSAKRTYVVIYYSFYQLCKRHFPNSEWGRNRIVDFLIQNIVDFDESKRLNLYSNLKDVKPKKMTFDIEKYLPVTKDEQNSTN